MNTFFANFGSEFGCLVEFSVGHVYYQYTVILKQVTNTIQIKQQVDINKNKKMDKWKQT